MTGEQSDRPTPVTRRAVILKSPAVRTVYGKRVYFTDDFKVHLLATLRKGNSPTDLFRSVGLPPEIIGRKRIDHLCGRVKDSDRVKEALQKNGDTWNEDDREVYWEEDDDTRIPDDPWTAIVGMSYRINALERRLAALERGSAT